jgi:hypothetical protein
MSQEQGNLPLSTRQPSDISQRIGSPGPQVTKERKKERFDDAINGAIVATKIARDAGDSAPLLSPFKTFLESLVTLLEAVKVKSCRSYLSTRTNTRTKGREEVQRRVAVSL